MPRTRSRSPQDRNSLPVPGITSPVEVRRHPSARRMTLRVSRTRRAVIVTLPAQCGTDAVAPFVTRHIEWVRQHLGCLPTPVPFADGAIVPLRGVLHRVVFAGRRERGSPVVEIVGMDGGGRQIIVSGDLEHAPRRLLDWFAAEARRDIEVRVAVHAAVLGLKPRRIAVRDQVSRWGSCSTTGVLSFSWRLILAPPDVLDYVAAHEVAHLKEMNHGPRFWALCRQAMPAMDAARLWLRASGMDLHRYGVAE
jgi:predicted metal-dependent hydrolase